MTTENTQHTAHSTPTSKGSEDQAQLKAEDIASLTIPQQIRAQQVKIYGSKKDMDQVISYANAMVSAPPAALTAICMIAYNTTLAMIADALEDAGTNTGTGTNAGDDSEEETHG